MKAYHRTQHADAIEADGFRDGEDFYLTANLHRGVWLSAPYPLDVNEGADGATVLEIEIPTELFEAHEWVEDEKPYREALIPADAVNANLKGMRRVSAEEALEIRWGTGDARYIAVHDENGRFVNFIDRDTGKSVWALSRHPTLALARDSAEVANVWGVGYRLLGEFPLE